jgi:zinc/manganese transport system substrate-binding protein
MFATSDIGTRRGETIARRTLPVLLAALALAALVPACGDGAVGETGTTGPKIVATTGIAADIAAAVAGPEAGVVQLVPDGAEPHSYAPSAREQRDLEDADLLVYFSPALEQGLPLDGAAEQFEIAAHVGDVRRESDGGVADPHVWLDPTLVSAALPELAATLAELDPDGAAGYERRGREYAAELEDLDAELQAVAETVPTANRKLVTSHELLGYFADRYDYEFIGAPFGTSPEAGAGASSIADLIDAVEDDRVPAVFAQRGDDPEVLRRVADEAGVTVVDDLLVESLGPEADTYPEMMRLTAGRIAEALRSGGTG